MASRVVAISVDPSADRAERDDSSVYERRVLEALPIVDRIVHRLGRRYRLSWQQHEDLVAAAHLRLLDHDYAVLRKYEGRSSLATYLHAVVTRLVLDERVKAWGRWRPSAEATRLGPSAVALERLLEQQRLSLDEAIEMLRRRDPSLDERALYDLAARLPRRAVGRRFVDDSALRDVPSPAGDAERLVHEAEARAACRHVKHALHDAISDLPARARLLIRLRFDQGATVADIARLLQEPQKPLYREIAQALRLLRRGLATRRVSPAHLHAAFEYPWNRLAS